jgi:FMN reductase
MPDVVVISGHPSPGSRTLQLARTVGERLAVRDAAGAVTVVDVAELAPALLSPRGGAAGAALRAVQDATLLVVATPTYRGTYTGMLKVFLDQLPANALAGVVAMPVVTAEFQPQAEIAEAFLARLLRELGADVVDFGLIATESELADPAAVADQYTAAITT